MNAGVIDASVMAMLLFREAHSMAAENWMRRTQRPLAPDLIWAEVANVVWKRHRRQEISTTEALAITDQLLAAPIHIYPSSDLIKDATELALKFDRTIYDSLYLALAIRTKTVLVSGDKRLVNSLKNTNIEKYVVWIGNSK